MPNNKPNKTTGKNARPTLAGVSVFFWWIMTNFLIKLFIGKNADANDKAVRGKYAAFASGVGIFVNLLLFAGKLTVGLIAASMAIIADAFNNIFDAASVVIAFVGFRLAAKPVDKEHPQGHGRLEYVSAFIVDAMIIVVGFELFKGSLDKILHPVLPTVGTVTLIILAASIFVKVWLYFFYNKIAKIISSSALKGSAADSLTDSIATLLVLVSALVSKFTGVSIDGFAGILVATFILFTGVKAAKETIDLLLGSPPDPAFVQDIYRFANNPTDYPSVVGIHDVMVHDYGPGRQIVSFHAEVPSNCDINIAHEEVDKLERDMHEKFSCLVTVHLDPIVVNDPLVNELKTLCVQSAKEINEQFTLHDFRMTKGETKINVIFDLVLPSDCNLSPQVAEKAVAEKIKEKNPDCSAVIRAEHPFV